MSLGQAFLDRQTARGLRALRPRLETVSVAHRATPTGAVTVFGPWTDCMVVQPSTHLVAMAALAGQQPLVMRSDKVFCLRVPAVTWTLTLYDEVIRQDGSHWRVQPQGISGGPGHPFWALHTRRVPG